MDDVSDLRLATAEERMTEYIAEKTADARAQLATLERATRPEHRRSPVTSRGAGGHRGNRHHSSSFVIVIFKRTTTPNFDAAMDDRDELIDYVCLDLTDGQTIEANETHELLVDLGHLRNEILTWRPRQRYECWECVQD